jgi:glycosyltransferase involved in cell wall biosynthesis
MKITFVCPPLNMTGGIRVVALHAKYLRAFGHDVQVVAPPRATRGRWADLRRKLRLPPVAVRPQPPSHFDGTGVPVHLLERPRRVLKSDVPDADVIVATWWETAEMVAAMPAAKGRKVYFVQGHEVFKHQPIDRVLATYRSDFQKIAVARWLADAIEADGNRQGCTIVPNAVDRTLFFAPPRARNARPRLGTLFSENDNKSFDIALAVIARVREALPEVEVVALGSDAPVAYRDRLDGIALTLQAPQAALREVYASCDVWLTCSKTEGFNLMAMEAMACRTPVVSTRTGWPVEAIVDGVNGALAPVDDVAGLAAAVLRILRLDAAQWRALSDGAARTVADSSWERSARLFEAAINGNEKIAAA